MDVQTLPKIFRVSTVPQTLHTLIRHQADYLNNHFDFVMASGVSDQTDTDYGLLPYKYYKIPLIRSIHPLKDIKAIYVLYKILKKEKPDIIHSHTPKAGLVAMLAGWFAKVPIRFHSVAGMPLETTKGIKKDILMLVEKTTYACSSQVIPNSYGMKKFLESKKLVARHKIKLLANGGSLGIDIDYFKRSEAIEYEAKNLRERINIKKGDIVCCFVGRITKQKGVPELLEAFAEIFDKHSNVKLFLLGRMEKHLDALPKQYLKAIQTHPQIFYFGYQRDIRPYMALTDIFVFPSHREGLPNVVLQAAAMDLPSVVTDISGSNEIVQDGINGKIVPVRDKNALKNAVLFCVNNPKERIQMSEQARKMVMEKYNKKIVLESLKEEYEIWIKKAV